MQINSDLSQQNVTKISSTSSFIFSYSEKTNDEKIRIINSFETLNPKCEIKDINDLVDIILYTQKIINTENLTQAHIDIISTALGANKALQISDAVDIEHFTKDLILAATHKPTFCSKYFPQFHNTQTIDAILSKIASHSCQYPDGSIYIGSWKDGLFHGLGRMQYANKDQYYGQWENGEYHGQGIYTFANGQKYEGTWKNGKRHGMGTEYSSNGNSVHQGLWENDKRNGHGMMTLMSKNGNATVECNWIDDWCDGPGKITFASGQECVGKWIKTAHENIRLFIDKSTENIQHMSIFCERKGKVYITHFSI